MAKLQYALEPGGARRLQVLCTGCFKNIRICLDGAELGTIADQKALEEGRPFSLPDGSPLHVQLVRNFLAPEVRVSRNGIPLPGSSTDPARRIRTAADLLHLVGIANIILGLVAVRGHVVLLQHLGLGYNSVAEGAVYVTLALLVRRKSLIALGLAAVLFCADTILVTMNNPHAAGGLVVRFIILVGLLQGFGALWAQKKNG
ncbi:MAG: hypothetical protein LC772_05310 [Chloroflexi bacterium]|nr:hypothetical protein [Chloroflexota bacterium]